MNKMKFKVWHTVEKKMYKWGFVLNMDGIVIKIRENCPDTGDEQLDYDDSDFLIPLQYTGVDDIDGFEVYEGDIIATTWYDGEYIRSNPKLFVVSEYYHFYKWKRFMERGDGFCVRGNIYENRELHEQLLNQD